MLWHTPLQARSNRPVAWSAGEINPITCEHEDATLKPVDSYHYADTDDSFEREPFVMRFKSLKASVKDFFVIPLQRIPRRRLRRSAPWSRSTTTP